jgi:hypothetical protein
MTKTKRRIILTPEERRELEAFTRSGMRSVKLFKRASIILACDTSEGRKPDKEESIAERIWVNRHTVQNAKRDFLASRDLKVFLRRKKRATPPVPAKVTGEIEALIIALACSKPPEGYSTWSLRLLANKCVELQYIDSISHTTVSRVLKKKHRLNLT